MTARRHRAAVLTEQAQTLLADRLNVRRNRQTGRWSIRRGSRLIRAGMLWAEALETAVRIADADRVAAKARR